MDTNKYLIGVLKNAIQISREETNAEQAARYIAFLKDTIEKGAYHELPQDLIDAIVNLVGELSKAKSALAEIQK